MMVRTVKVLIAHYGDRLQSLILFGSVARQTPSPNSDIDLLVVLKPPFDYFQELSNLVDILYPLQLEALLLYGHRRLSLDFWAAKQAIALFKSAIAPQWYSEIDLLNSQNDRALLQEIYFNAVIELKNQRFSNFLVRLSQFQEKSCNIRSAKKFSYNYLSLLRKPSHFGLSLVQVILSYFSAFQDTIPINPFTKLNQIIITELNRSMFNLQGI